MIPFATTSVSSEENTKKQFDSSCFRHGSARELVERVGIYRTRNRCIYAAEYRLIALICDMSG